MFADYSLDGNSTDLRSHYRNTFNSSPNKLSSDKSRRAGKINKPDPTNVHFLYENTRFVNEPVCNAATKSTRHEQHVWWPSEVPSDANLEPPYSLDSSNRSAFRPLDPSKRPRGLTRFSCIDGKRRVAIGIVPVTLLPASHVKTERISYDHQFDSRRDTRARGKLHGSLVWDTTEKNKEACHRRFAKRHFFHGVAKDTQDPTPSSLETPRASPIKKMTDRLQVENYSVVNEYPTVYQTPKKPMSGGRKSVRIQQELDKAEVPLQRFKDDKIMRRGSVESPPPHLF